MSEGAEAVRALAALIRCGLPPRAALCAWHEQLDGDWRCAALRVRNQLELGGSIDRSLANLEKAFGSDANLIRAAAGMHTAAGGDLARMLDGVARSIAERAERAEAAHAAATGALLSARMVAALPLVFLPLTPLTRAPLFDLVGLILIGAGGALALAGLRWIKRLVPPPPVDDEPAAVVADLVAAALRGGIGLDAALEATALHAPHELEAQLRTARSMVALGLAWSDALARSGDRRLGSLAAVLARGRRFGVPIVGALEGSAAAARETRSRDFESRLRRAPVLMVVPLTVCVLPSFALLALAPFVRGLSISP